MISRDEKKHSILKRQLRSFTEDLKTMMNEINLLLMNEYHNYLMKFEDAKLRLLMKLRKSIYQQLTAYVISHALRKIDVQYNLLVNQSSALFACSKAFITTIELSCSHKIQERLYDEEFLLLEDVHSH
jgi:hypothetical protein